MPKQKFNISKIATVGLKDASIDTEKDMNRLGELAERIHNVSEEGDYPFRFKIIPRNRIAFNKDNDYPQIEIEKLADSILHNGLIHNLEAYYDDETDTYVLESGERRTRAIDYLLERFKSYDADESIEYRLYLKNIAGYQKGYPINVKKRPEPKDDGYTNRLNEIDSQLRLIDANEEVRPDDPPAKLKRILVRNKLLEERGKLLGGEKININKSIAAAEQISERQVQKYKNISKLIPELQEAFQQNNITLAEGDNYSKLSEEEQLVIVDLIKQNHKISMQEFVAIKEKLVEEQKKKEDTLAEIDRKDTLIAELIREKENSSEKLKVSYEKMIQDIKDEAKKTLSEHDGNIQNLEEKIKQLEIAKNKELEENSKKFEKLIQDRERSILDKLSGEELEKFQTQVRLEAAADNVHRSISEFYKILEKAQKLHVNEKDIATIRNSLQNILGRNNDNI